MKHVAHKPPMTNDLPATPDKHGMPAERVAYDILQLNPHAVVPSEPREARALLDRLQREAPQMRLTGSALRGGQYHDLYNGSLELLRKAKSLGLRPRDATLPPPPDVVTPDDLAALQSVVNELGEDVDRRESCTLEQWRILKLEADIKALKAQNKAIIGHSNQLVTWLKELDVKFADLEARLKVVMRHDP